MAKPVAQLIRFVLIPIMGQLNNRVGLHIAIADKGQGKLAALIIGMAQKGHPQQPRIEINRTVQIFYPDHGVKHPRF